jgi:serine/threonine-protein kinase
MVAPPTNAGGVLLIPERDGVLHAFDLEAREVLWTYDLEGELWGGPAVSDRRVFVASWSQTVRCLALATGDDLWHVELDAPVTASPVVAGGTLLVATEGGTLYAFDARSGRQLGRHRVSSAAIQASPLPAGATIVVAALDGTVAAFG